MTAAMSTGDFALLVIAIWGVVFGSLALWGLSGRRWEVPTIRVARDWKIGAEDSPEYESDGRTVRIYYQGEESVYNEQLLRAVIENVRSQRGSYGTEKAWRRALDRVEYALVFLLDKRR